MSQNQLVITQENITEVKSDLAGEDIENTLALDEAPTPGLNPDIFLGQSRSELITTLGGEDYRRLDQGVEVLQFRMPSCVIDFVMSSTDGVTSYHTRHRVSGQHYDDVTCRLDLATRRDSPN